VQDRSYDFISPCLTVDLGRIVVNNFTLSKAVQKCPRTDEQQDHLTQALELIRKFNHVKSTGDIIFAKISGVSAYVSVCNNFSKKHELLQQLEIKVVIDYLKVDGSFQKLSPEVCNKSHVPKQDLVSFYRFCHNLIFTSQPNLRFYDFF